MSRISLIKRQCHRLGFQISDPTVGTVIDTLNNPESLPRGSYFARVPRFKEMLKEYAIDDLDDCNDDELEQEMPLIIELEFCDQTGFYDDWQNDLPNVSDGFTPIANDIYNYFFLTSNDLDNSDPLIFCIDHEEMDKPPERYMGYTLGMFLSILDAG